MEDYLECMFCVPILHIMCRNWKKKQEKILEYIEENEDIFSLEGKVITNYFHSSKDSNNFFQELFEDELNLFQKKIEYETKKIHSSWIEISKTKNHHPVHNHQSRGYTGICYVKFDKNLHEPTQFISPFLDFLKGNVIYYEPDVEEGSLVFFPSAIMHYSRPNESEEDRIISSFNIREYD